MAKIIINREKSIFLSLFKWNIYLDGEKIGQVSNGKSIDLNVPIGTHNLSTNCPNFLLPTSKKSLFSNNLKMNFEEDETYSFNIGAHPLSWWGRRYPNYLHPFTSVQCLLLIQKNDKVSQHHQYLSEVGAQIKSEISHFSYHIFSILFIALFGIFSMVNNTLYPELNEARTGVAWMFLFGLASLLGLFSGFNKVMIAKGWEYKSLTFVAIQSLIILLMLPVANFSQILIYSSFFLTAIIGAFWSFYIWKRNKIGLDTLERTSLEVESRLGS